MRKATPELDDGEKIISAKFNFETTNGTSLFTSATDSPIIINAHKLKSINSNIVSYDSDILDYDSLTYNDNQYMSFDLTKTVNEWYDNGDSIDGFVLESFAAAGSKTVSFKESTRTSTTPSLTFIYKDFTGTESNLSYHKIPVGHNAQASVSDYLGNLVINQSLYEGTGSRMPVTLTATYNSINYNAVFANGSPSGYGWQFSFNQYVRDASTALANKGYNYIYTDSDGTDHYLKKSDNSEEWYDEDGLGITLTKTDTNILIDNGSVTQTYELTSAGGKLLSEKDEYNNEIKYIYEDGNLTEIKDVLDSDTERVLIQLIYANNSDGNKRISFINTPGNKTINFSYTSTLKDKINAITFADGKQTKFEYDSSGRLLSVIQADVHSTPSQQNKYTFTNSNGKVSKITEYGNDNTEGNYLNITYGNDNTTEFSDRQGRKATYTFDNFGNKVSVLNANGYLENSDSNGLSISSGADSFTKNYITESTEQNAVGSGKYYFQTDGGRNGVTSSGGTVTIDDSDPTEENGQIQYFGTTSIKVTNPVSSTNSAFYTGATHQIDGTEFNGKDITFSAYVKTKDVTMIYSGGSIGATLEIMCYDSSGAMLKDVNSIGISGTQDWQRLSVSVKVPDDTSCIRLFCNLRYSSGTAWFDCLQLEEGNCANDFNALQNGNFENNDNWLTNENNAISAQNGTVTLNGKAAFYDNAEITDETTSPDEEETQPATYYETVEETVPNDSVTTYDSYGNVLRTEQGFVTRTVKNTYEVKSTEPTTGDSNTDPEDDSDSSDASDEDSNEPVTSFGNKYIYQNVKVGRAGVAFNIVGEAKAKSVPLSNENRTFGIALNIYYEGNNTPETHYQEFNATTSHRQTVCMSVTPEKTTTKISRVAFAFVYSNNANSMTAYNGMLNIASAYASDNNDDNTETETDDNLIDCEVISENVDTTQEYMATSSIYDDTNNYAISETDEAGNTVTYTYDTNGNKTSITDGVGNVTNYTYNSGNNITSISSGSAQNQYSYNSTNNISAITHNGFSYTFNYDVWGNLISTKIGDVALVSNTYSSNNGNLTKTTYANGDYIEYTYDEYDNITKFTSETGVIAEFVYNKKGLVAKAVDNSSETTTYYYYDFSGNLTGEYRQTDGGDLSYFLSYDSDGNKVEKTSINGQTKTITIGTDEDGESYVSNDGVTAKTTTDDFGRTAEVKTIRGEGNSVFFTDYEYASGTEENSTTNLVSKLTPKYGADELVNYEYSYDGNGNITQIYENGTLAHKYTYDSLNQLKEEYDYINKFYINYSYDSAGNLKAKNQQYLDPTYGYPSGSPTGNVYEYTDTEWKDKVTKINGDTITYDESGNPLSYRNGMTFTWQNGRQLTSLQTADNSVSYKYDSNGMRTQKTDNSGTTYYYYDSDKNLIGLTKDNDTLLFYYDSDSNVTSFKYNGTMYYYIKNLQGDVVKIINQAGTEAAGYIYDAWGNIKSTSGEPTLRELNPFRYRSYLYDTESGLYYLQSRYYDPEVGRFLSTDVVISGGYLVGANLYSYCYNNPLMYYDDDGFLPKLSKSRISSDTIKIQISDKLKSIATYLAISAAKDAIGAAVCAFIPGAQVGALVLSISTALKTLCSYLLDKYGGDKKVYIYAKVKYGIKVQTYTYWIFWPYSKGKITIKKLYIKELTTRWGIC
ncbi:MAG: RHS repeat-associated core domain-containing protein [Ruminococcus sp.]